MSSLLDEKEIPASPSVKVNVPTASDKPKRKNYYIPVAQRNRQEAELLKKHSEEKKAAKKAQKQGKSEPKKSSLVKNLKEVAKKAASKSKKEESKSSRSGSDTCGFCGKPLSRHTSVQAGMGDVCQAKQKMLPKGTTLSDHYEGITKTSVPDGYIKLKDAIEFFNKKGISTYRVLQAIGGDRMIRKPVNGNFKVVLVKGVRYINGASKSHWNELIKK